MSVLEIYIQWVNSVLSETGSIVGGAEAVQDGKVLCQLIDVLAPSACLVSKVKSSGSCTPLDYVNAAFEHMQKHGIRIKFSSQDIINNEIKSILDILWILILNYSIHNIGQNAFQRSVGSGKKNLLEWCMEQLGTTFDFGKTLSENLCQGDWFIKLLEKAIGGHVPRTEVKIDYIDALLTEVQNCYGIRKEILKASDVSDGTVDEHTLMIYLSLMRRMCPFSNLPRKSSYGDNASTARDRFADQKSSHVFEPGTSRSQDQVDGTDQSTRTGQSSRNSVERPSRPVYPGLSSSHQSRSFDNDGLYATVIENVAYTKSSHQLGQAQERMPLKSNSRPNLQRQGKVISGSFGDSFSGQENLNSDRMKNVASEKKAENITIRRPKDYLLQWEDTMERLTSSASSRESNNFKSLPLERSKSCDLGNLILYPDRLSEDKFTERKSKSTEFLSQAHKYKFPYKSSQLISSPVNISQFESVDLALKKLPISMQERAKNASKFFLQADTPEVSDLIDVIQASRNHRQSSRSQSYSSLVEDDGEQTSLKTVSRSASPVSLRFHSFSPRRRNFSPIHRANGEERGSNTMLSIYPRGRSGSVSPSRERSPEIKISQKMIERLEKSDFGEHYTASMNLDEDKSNFQYNRYQRDTSPPVERSGGIGRVPRREAWEQQRRLYDTPSVNDSSETWNQHRKPYQSPSRNNSTEIVSSLSQEIQWLKEKVAELEVEKNERRRSLSRSRLLQDSNSNEAPVISSLQFSRERATSCPLLTISVRPSLLKNLHYKSEANLNQQLRPRSPHVLLATGGEQPQMVTPPRQRHSNASFPSLDTLSFPRWKQLINKSQLSEAEIVELKQALACAVADNDMLASRLEAGREEVYNKLRHTNSVLDDCRHHLAKAQVENMEFRSQLQQEKHRNAVLEKKVKEMELYFSELKASNAELEDELGETTNMLSQSLHETMPEVQSLQLENVQLASRLSEAENENDFLREDVKNLKQRHAKAMDTIEELKDILSKVRKERQELFDELAARDQREQTARVLRIMSNYQEKGSKDAEEIERGFRPATAKTISPEKGLNLNSASPGSSHQQIYDENDWSLTREIYPHRQSYMPHSRSCSPSHSNQRLHGGTLSVSPVGRRKHQKDVNKENLSAFSSDHSRASALSSKYSHNTDRSYKNLSLLKRKTSPSFSHVSQGKIYNSMQNLPGRYSRSPSPRPSILKGKEQQFRPESTVSLKSSSCILSSKQSPESRRKERPLHKKTESGEIARYVQRELEQEDLLLQVLSNSSMLQNKSWFELQSDSEESDTGINSSFSSCDNSVRSGRSTPILTEDQRRYAEHLVQKYTGNIS